MKSCLLMSLLLLVVVASSGQSSKAQASKKVVSAKNTPPATTPKTKESSSQLAATFGAPAGINIVLQNNGKNDFPVSAAKESGKIFSSTAFNIGAPLPDSSKYNITVKKIPAGQTCRIYSGAEGVMPQGDEKVRIGCDYSYDLVSRTSNDKTFSTFYESSDAVVGGNPGEEGRYVAFISSSADFAGSTGKHRQVFWRDRNTGETKLISTADGQEGNGDCYAPAISGDGKTVAFESTSTNLVPNDKNGYKDVFIWNSITSKIERVSVGDNGKEPNAESYEASVSGNGNLVAFTSAASNISATEKGVSDNNVFLFDVESKKTIMISLDPFARKGGGGSRPSISYDGNRIAFYSHASTLVANDNNGLWDIFLWEKGSVTLKRISKTSDGKERNQGIESANRIVAPAISGDGRYIAFATTASNMVPGDVNGFQDIFVYDTNTGNTVIASNGVDGKPGNNDSPIGQGEKIAISFDGKWIAFSTNASNLGVPAANIVMHNMATAKNFAVSNVVGSSVGRPTMSYSGSYVVFGIGGKLDARYGSSGMFASYTGVGPCRSCPQ